MKSQAVIEQDESVSSRLLSKKLQVVIVLSFGVALVCCSALSDYEVSSILSIIVFSGYLLYIAFTKPKHILKYLAFFFAVIANILGCAICEFSDVFLSEIVTYSGYVGSLPLLVFGRWLFLVVLLWFDSKWDIQYDQLSLKTSITGLKWLNVITIGVLLICLVCFARVLGNPAFSLDADRFLYSMNYLEGVWGAITNSLVYLAIFPALSIMKGNKKLGVVTTVILLLYLFWIGNKFGSFFSLLCIFIMVFYEKLHNASERAVRRVLLSVLVMFFCLVAVATTIYGFSGEKDDFEYLFSRTSQQGQLWWKTYAFYKNDHHPETFIHEIDAAINSAESISSNVGSQHAVYKIMYLTTPSNIVDNKLLSGSRYTEAGYACAYYYFGVPGVIVFSVLGALLVVAIVRALLLALYRGLLIDAVIITRFFFLARGMLTMFVVNGFFDTVSILCYAYLFISYLVQKRIPEKEQ